MKNDFKLEIEKALNSYFNKTEKIISFNGVGGGCINNGSTIITESDKTFFVKYNYNCPENMFNCEENGLKELKKSNTIKVPNVIVSGGGKDGIPLFLILENIKPSRKIDSFYEDFGKKFARMHKYTSDKYGFYENNYIGSTPQINTYEDDWLTFYKKHRLGYQIELAKKKHIATYELLKGMDKLLNKLDTIISSVKEPPALLHGDLWGGNYMIGNNGEVVLIDPAVYYGDREADLAMTEMFGGFPPSFYNAYNEEYPPKQGYKERSKIYKLYHYLNHLNLFGSGYLDVCLSIIRKFV